MFFDNLQVVHTRGALLEETHYYPFGLTMAGISSKVFKGNYAENKKRFVSQDFDDDFGFNLYQFRYRNHDPQIGRFVEIDPLADKYEYNSTYAYAENRVINGIDLEGLEWLGIPLLGNSSTIARGPVIEQVVKQTVEFGTETGGRAPKIEEHHLIPREFKNDPLVRSARDGGFKFEGKENKIPLEKFSKETGEGQHGNHPNYNAEFARRFSEFKKDNPKYTPEEATEFMRSLNKEVKEVIKNNPNTKINDLFKGVDMPAPIRDGILIGLPNPNLRSTKKEEKQKVVEVICEMCA